MLSKYSIPFYSLEFKKCEDKTSASDPDQPWINIGSAFDWLLDPDPHSIGSWIRIRIQNADPGGVIPAENKTENKKQSKNNEQKHV
jgi:hypothetical protein